MACRDLNGSSDAQSSTHRTNLVRRGHRAASPSPGPNHSTRSVYLPEQSGSAFRVQPEGLAREGELRLELRRLPSELFADRPAMESGNTQKARSAAADLALPA